MIFRRFPYTNLNDINLDWIIKQVKQIAAALLSKQDKPDLPGVSGQVLGLDENLDPVWLDQSGGGGTNNYNNLINKPQINSVTLSGNKTAADLGLANASDIPTVPVQSVNGQTGAVELDAADVGALPSNTFIPGYSLQLPVMDGEASAGTTYARYSMEGHVHPTDTSRASISDIAIVQNTDTATQNITVGQYVIWKGVLYTASTAIASGATLSSSNLSAVSDGGLNSVDFRAIRRLYSTDDLDNIRGTGATGLYYIGANVPNSPFDYAMMLVLSREGDIGYCIQLVLGREVDYREFAGSPPYWRSWKRLDNV